MSDVYLTSASLGSANASTQLPSLLSAAILPGDTSAPMPLLFPASAGSRGSTVSLRVGGYWIDPATFNAIPFNYPISVTLP